MGSVFSKAPRTARSYPTRSSLKPRSAPAAENPSHPAHPSTTTNPQHSQPHLQRHGGQERAPPASTTAAPTSHEDPTAGADPSLAAHLRKLGPVVPFPTHSNTSAFNPSLLDARSSLSPAAAAAASNPSMAPSEIIHKTNPALTLLDARERLARQAEDEVEGYVGADGRQFASVRILRDVLQMRGRIEDESESGSGSESKDESRRVAGRLLGMGVEEDGEIEKRFGLKRGSVGKLGKKGVVENV